MRNSGLDDFVQATTSDDSSAGLRFLRASVTDIAFTNSKDMVIWLFGYLVIWLFDYLVIWLFGFWSRGCEEFLPRAGVVTRPRTLPRPEAERPSLRCH